MIIFTLFINLFFLTINLVSGVWFPAMSILEIILIFFLFIEFYIQKIVDLFIFKILEEFLYRS